MKLAANMSTMKIMITVKNLSKRYGQAPAITNLSFVVPDGAVTGFLGPNGSGKSTTMRCMLGLDSPTTGEVIFQGAGYSGTFASLSNKMQVAGALLDANWFDPSITGRNHLRAIAAGAGISTARVDECLELVGLLSAANKRAGNYSLGMKQRLGLAAALLGDPQHLIMDEPVNGLDPEGVMWMRKVIQDFAQQGRAVLVSSHLLTEMELIADRVVVIGKGELIGEYELDEFLNDQVVVEVETAQAAQLHTLLQGVEVVRDEDMLRIKVPRELSDHEMRVKIATLAQEHQILITKMASQRKHLEQRFMEATAAAQEYTAGTK